MIINMVFFLWLPKQDEFPLGTGVSVYGTQCERPVPSKFSREKKGFLGSILWYDIYDKIVFLYFKGLETFEIPRGKM